MSHTRLGKPLGAMLCLLLLCLIGCKAAPKKEQTEAKATQETITEIRKQQQAKSEASASTDDTASKKKSWTQHAKDDWGDMPHNLGEDIKGIFDRENIVHNAVVLGGAGLLTGLSIDHWDTTCRKRLREHDLLGDWDEVGNVLGHPGTHWGIMGLLYAESKINDDPRNLEASKRLAEALTLDHITVLLLKVATGRNRPNSDKFSFPSGHVSSTFTLAAVCDGMYGHWVGVPLYALGAFVGLARMDAHRHHLSDVIFGAALGYVFGRTVTKVHQRKLLGFDVAPYVDPTTQAGGIILQRRF